MPVSISKLPEVTNVKDNSFMLITQDGTTKRTMCDQFVTEEEARLDEFSPTVITSKSISKTGEGDNVDYSSSAYDAPMKDVVLKGKTMVNCIQGPSSQDVVLPYEFEDGQYVTINDTKESGALGVELKGQTLVNLLGEIAVDLNRMAWSEDENNYNLNLAAGNGQPTLSFRTLYTLPANKTYTLFINMTSYTTGLIHIDFRTPSNTSSSSNQYYFGETGWKKLVFTTTDETGFVRMFNRGGVDNTFSISKSLILLEGDHTNTPIPNYFTGMASCKMPILRTVGKNLFDGQIIRNACLSNDGNYYNLDGAVTFSHMVYVKGLKEIYLSISNSYASGMSMVYSLYDKNKKFITRAYGNYYPETGAKFSISDDVYYLKATFHTFSTTAISDDVDIKIQLEGKSVTSYEPYKTSILSTNEDLELRGIGDVQDTLDLNTGKLTSYYGERIVTEDDSFSTTLLDGKCTCIVGNMTDKISSYASDNFLADKVPHGAPANTDFGIYQNLGNFVIYETGDDLEAFKSKVIGTKIYYRLAEPVNKAVDLKVVDQNGNVIPTLKSWNTTTHIYSEIPENSLYPILSHSNPSYPVILKPSTKYSIVANSYSNDHTNSVINFNLGGATASTTVGSRVTTITTPSTLSNELLTMSGRCNKLNNVMVIEGDVVGDEPYFEGICDCKSPILSNVGKNLFNIDGDINQTYNGWYAPHKNMLCDVNTILINAYSHSNKGSGQIINVRPNTNYRVWYGQTGKCRVMISDSQGNQLGMQDLYGATEYTKIDFNSSQNTNVLLHFTTLGDSSVGKATVKNIFFGERTENFVYEPYKSNILSIPAYYDEESDSDKTIVLRSLPSGVCDTLNVETGEYVQRIGEVVLDGEIGMWLYPHQVRENTLENAICFQTVDISDMSSRWGSANMIYCDKLHYGNNNFGDPIESTYWGCSTNIISRMNKQLVICIDKTETNVNNQNELVNWLKSNPLTIQYKLATPIVTTIDVQGFPYAYANGHVQLSSGSIEQSLTPKVEYNIATNRGGQITQNTKSLIRQGKLLNDIENKINQIIEATVNDGIMLMKLRNK